MSDRLAHPPDIRILRPTGLSRTMLAIRVLPVFALIAAVFAAVAAVPARDAFACTPVPGYDAIADSPHIVEGRVVAWESVASGQLIYRVEVTRSFKGAPRAGDTVVVHDFGSFYNGDWVAGGGLCGTFDAEPAGMHIVIGLEDGGGAGEYRSENRNRLFLGPEPSGAAYEQAIERVLGPDSGETPGTSTDTPEAGTDTPEAPLPPDVGEGTRDSDGTRWLPWLAVAGAIAAAASAVGLARRRR